MILIVGLLRLICSSRIPVALWFLLITLRLVNLRLQQPRLLRLLVWDLPHVPHTHHSHFVTAPHIRLLRCSGRDFG